MSFLITTPENWVPALGDSEHGFPYLSGRGRLVVKDVIMLGAAWVTMADSARAFLRKRGSLASNGDLSSRVATSGESLTRTSVGVTASR